MFARWLHIILLAVFFHGLFFTGFVHVPLKLCKVTQVFIIWSSSVPLFSSSEALFISSDFEIFIIKLVLSSKFVLSFRSSFDILHKKGLSMCYLWGYSVLNNLTNHRLLFNLKAWTQKFNISFVIITFRQCKYKSGFCSSKNTAILEWIEPF